MSDFTSSTYVVCSEIVCKSTEKHAAVATIQLPWQVARWLNYPPFVKVELFAAFIRALVFKISVPSSVNDKTRQAAQRTSASFGVYLIQVNVTSQGTAVFCFAYASQPASSASVCKRHAV